MITKLKALLILMILINTYCSSNIINIFETESNYISGLSIFPEENILSYFDENYIYLYKYKNPFNRNILNKFKIHGFAGYRSYDGELSFSDDKSKFAIVTDDVFIKIYIKEKDKYIFFKTLKDKRAIVAGLYTPTYYAKFIPGSNLLISGHAGNYIPTTNEPDVINIWNFDDIPINHQEIYIPNLYHYIWINNRGNQFIVGNNNLIYIFQKSFNNKFNINKTIHIDATYIDSIYKIENENNLILFCKNQEIKILNLKTDKIISYFKITSIPYTPIKRLIYDLRNNIFYILYGCQNPDMDIKPSTIDILKISGNKIQHISTIHFNDFVISDIAYDKVDKLFISYYRYNGKYSFDDPEIKSKIAIIDYNKMRNNNYKINLK